MLRNLKRLFFGAGFANRLLWKLNSPGKRHIFSFLDKHINYFVRGRKISFNPLNKRLLETFLDGPIDLLRLDLGLASCVPNNAVALHIRGGDFYQWKSHSIMSAEWYIKCINCVDQPLKIVFLYTDDINDPRIEQILDYLRANRLGFVIDNSSTLSSWFKLLNSGLLIVSPSTFSIAAGMIGDSKIMISKSYVDIERNTSEFWKAVSNGEFENIRLV